jgi:hypothetical protein
MLSTLGLFMVWVGRQTSQEMNNKFADKHIKKNFLYNRLMVQTNDGYVSGKLITTANGYRQEKQFQIVLD